MKYTTSLSFLFLATSITLIAVSLKLMDTRKQLAYEERVSDYWRNKVNTEVTINNRIWSLIEEKNKEKAEAILNEELEKSYKSDNPYWDCPQAECMLDSHAK